MSAEDLPGCIPNFETIAQKRGFMSRRYGHFMSYVNTMIHDGHDKTVLTSRTLESPKLAGEQTLVDEHG